MLQATKRFAERLGGALALVTVLVALAGLSAVAALHTVGVKVVPPTPHAQEAEALRADALRAVVAERNYAQTKDQRWIDARNGAEATLDQSIGKLRTVLTSSTAKTQLDRVEQQSRDLGLALARDAIGATMGLGDPRALLNDITSTVQSLDRSVTGLVDVARQIDFDAWRSTQATVARARRAVAAGAAAAVLLAAGLGLLLIRRFSREFERAQETVRAREEFLSVASEELSRPLSALAHHVEPVREALHRPTEGSAQGVLAHHLDVANEELTRLETLVHELHEAAQLRSGRETMRRESLDLAALSREVVAGFNARLRGSGTSIVVNAPSAVPGFWDRGRLKEAVTQILSAAIRHGAGRVVKVSVEEGDPARLSVRDHGAGLTTEQLAHLFEPYDASAEPDHTQTLGLGLYIARKIVEEHGGSMRVVSNPGMGVLYLVELPRTAPVARVPWQRRAVPARRAAARV